MQTTISSRRPYLRAAVYLLLTVLLCAPTHGQAKDQDVFAPVPTPLRARLVERLKLLVEYQHTQQWEKQYDLLSVLVTQGDSKEDHVRRLQRWYTEGLGDVLVDFTPKSVTYEGGGPSDAVIFGCAKLRKNGSVMKLYASVEAYREKEDWYFSSVGIITPVGGQPEPCPYSSAVARPSSCSATRGKGSSERRQR